MGKDFAKLLKKHRKSVRIFLRSKKDNFLALASLTSLGLSVGILVLVLCSIVTNGYKALTITKVLLHFDSANFSSREGNDLRDNCVKLIMTALRRELGDVINFDDPATKRMASSIISETAHYDLAHMVQKGVNIAGTSVWLSTSTDFSSSAPGRNLIYDEAKRVFKERGHIKKFFNHYLFTNSHSKAPENAGIIGALVGSLLTIAVCLAIAIPLGIMAGICMQEILTNSRIASTVEISINNLSSVPSIIFGVLGLIVYLNIFGVPRSSALAGGMTLSIMILPNLIMSTRQALASVPESVKLAAFSLGASEMQVIMHHSLPMALPALIQGVLVSIARIIGESSPLIMIGMVAFVADLPKTFLDPASVLPVQIYIWANNYSSEFTNVSAIAIVGLLLILLVLNIIADLIKKRFDHFSF